MDIDDFGGWVDLNDFIDAVNSQMVQYPPGEVVFPVPPGEMSFADRVRKRRRDAYEEFLLEEAETKRNKVIDEEYEWLRNNKLFRGQPPKPGQGWDEFVADVERRQAEANARGDIPPVIEFPPDTSNFAGAVIDPAVNLPPVEAPVVEIGDVSGVANVPEDIREERARYYMENPDAAARDTRESPFGGNKKRKRSSKNPLGFLKNKIFKS